MSSAKIDTLRNFDALPDSAIVHTHVTSAVTGLSDRTVRHHPLLPRRYISRDRYGQQVGDIRRLLHEGVPASTIRPRVGPAGMRLLAEVQAAASRAEAEKVIYAFDNSTMADSERERLTALLADALSELPNEGSPVVTPLQPAPLDPGIIPGGIRDRALRAVYKRRQLNRQRKTPVDQEQSE